MKTIQQPLIIGGGLSGLALAYFLKKKGIEAIVVEAADRLGGRIHTIAGLLGTPLELGATWFSNMHTNLLSLIEELQLLKFVQYSGGISFFQTKSFEPPQQFFVPAAEQPSYRIAGGTQRLIEVLTERLLPEQILLQTKILSIRDAATHLEVRRSDGSIMHAEQVIVCIPPQLAAASITYSPGLPGNVDEILTTVQNWMAGTIKFTLEYSEPFWRKQGYSGMIYSHAGIVTEMYDHTNFEENKYGFTGFLNGGSVHYSPTVRKELVLAQLCELFGEQIIRPSLYMDKVWNDELIIKGNPVFVQPHQNNGHPLFSSGYLNDRLHFCGTETADAFAGYMEGAVIAAKSIADKF